MQKSRGARTAPNTQEKLAMYAAGVPTDVIAAQFGCTAASIHTLARWHGVKRPMWRIKQVRSDANRQRKGVPKQPNRNPVSPHAPAVVKRLFTILDSEDVTIRSIAERAGHCPSKIATWRHGRQAKVSAIEDVAEVLGYRLALVRIRHEGS